MGRIAEIKHLSLTKSQHGSLMDYEADVSFQVSFGKMGYKVKGSVDLAENIPFAAMADKIIDTAFEDIKNIPAAYAAITNHFDRQAGESL